MPVGLWEGTVSTLVDFKGGHGAKKCWKRWEGGLSYTVKTRGLGLNRAVYSTLLCFPMVCHTHVRDGKCEHQEVKRYFTICKCSQA